MSGPVQKDPDVTVEEEDAMPLSRGSLHVEADTVIEDLPPTMARGFVYLLVITIILAVLWAWHSRMDVVAEAPGKTVPLGELVTVTAPFPGKLVSVAVAPGTRVNEGDLLFSIDPLEATARFEKAMYDLEEQERSADLLRQALGELEGVLSDPARAMRQGLAEYSSPEVAGAVVNVAKSWFDLLEARVPAGDTEAARLLNTREAQFTDEARAAQASSLEAALRAAASEIERAKQEEESAGLGVKQSSEQVKLLEDMLRRERKKAGELDKEAKTFEDLSEAGVVSRLQANSSRRAADQQAGEVVRIRTNLAQSRMELKQRLAAFAQARDAVAKQGSERDRARDNLDQLRAEVKLEKSRANRNLAVAEENHARAMNLARQLIRKIQSELDVRTSRIDSLRTDVSYASRLMERTDVLAEVSGIVTAATAFHPGEFVRPEEPVLQIAPDSAELVADVHVSNKDFARIKVGQTVKMKLEPFPYQIYGSVQGRVIKVFPDILAKSEKNEFRVLCSFDTAFIQGRYGPEPIRLGMALVADIKIDQRRIIDYIIEPILRLRDKFEGAAG